MSMLTAKIKTFINSKKYEEAQKKNLIVLNLFTEKDIPDTLKGEAAWSVKHPSHDARLEEYKKIIRETRTQHYDTISFGDSLMDGWTKDIFTAVPRCRNFNVGGSWANHMRDMYRAIFPVLLENRVRFDKVIIGTLGGNPFLMKQPLNLTIEKSLEVLNDLRKILPVQRIIVYGIPPTLSLYANENAPAFESAIYSWVVQDVNSVFLPLQRKFAKWGIFPKAVMSTDGVHFSEVGVKEFDALLVAAKTAKPRTIVD